MTREIRFWIPESFGTLKEYVNYFLCHPTSAVIGVYGFDAWMEEHQKMMKMAMERNAALREVNNLRTQVEDLKIQVKILKQQ